MNTGQIEKTQGADPYKQMQVDETLDSYLAETRRMEEKVFRDFQILPPVNPDGSSPCSFAEKLYAQAAQGADHLRHRHTILEEYQVAIDHKREKLAGELAAIETDAQKLKLGGVQEDYRKARDAQMARIAEVMQKKKGIQELLHLLDRTLALASFRKWPLGEPSQGRPPLVFGPDAPHDPPRKETRGPMRNPRNGLFEKNGPAVPPLTAPNFGPELEPLIHLIERTPPRELWK